jgi:hypothetical protein
MQKVLEVGTCVKLWCTLTKLVFIWKLDLTKWIWNKIVHWFLGKPYAQWPTSKIFRKFFVNIELNKLQDTKVIYETLLVPKTIVRLEPWSNVQHYAITTCTIAMRKKKQTNVRTWELFLKTLFTIFDEFWTKFFHCKPHATWPKWPNLNLQTMLPTKTIMQVLSPILHLQLIWKYKNFILSQFV